MGTLKQCEWETAWSLEDYVVSLFEDKKTDSEEFLRLIRIYGREKLVEIWKKYQEMKIVK